MILPISTYFGNGETPWTTVGSAIGDFAAFTGFPN